jgi:4-coumarate--CoA ligase (photoactive yellow protein activation family)
MTSGLLPRAAAHRIACAVVAAEIRRLRGTDLPLLPPDGWPEPLAVGDGGLGLDSMEQLGALGALAETFDLDDAMLGQDPPQVVGAWIDWVMRQHASGNGRLIVRTSGSTGSPVACAHAVTDLLAEATYLAARFSGRRRLVALVPAHHLYGIIWTALMPAMMGLPVIVRSIGTPLELASGDLVVAVPDQWQAMQRLSAHFPDDVIGVSSAGPLNDQVAANLLTAGLTRLVDIYGSSETGGIAIRELPATMYELLPRWHLVPLGDDDCQLADNRGLHNLPDHVERGDGQNLRPIGRRDGAVQVGGHNVWPGRVAEMLRAIDGVADAAVRLHTNGRLKAFIVPDGFIDPSELSVRIERAAVDQLGGPERPKSLKFGAALPRNAMGKLEDWA